MTIKINNIVRETEKAVLVNVNVCWNDGKGKAREIWFPKSTIKIFEDNFAEVADWFAKKLSYQNAFKGYLMTFRETFYTTI